MNKVVGAIVLCLLAFLAITGSAQASRGFLSYGEAFHATRQTSREVCERITQCSGSNAGRCLRESINRFSCIGANYFSYPEEIEVECNTIYYWGTDRNDHIKAGHYSKPYCFETAG